MASSEEQTLYDRVGGKDGIAHLVATLEMDVHIEREDRSAITDRVWRHANDVTGGYGFDGWIRLFPR